jgi:hypothetical protein
MQPRMKVALAGGGGAADSRLLDEVFATWLGPQGKLLYLPCALRGIRPFQSCLEWIAVTFASLNVTNITMWTDMSEHQASEKVLKMKTLRHIMMFRQNRPHQKISSLQNQYLFECLPICLRADRLILFSLSLLLPSGRGVRDG